MNPNRAIEIGTVTVIRDDCMNILSELKDNAYDLGIVDPPYGINAPKMSMGTTLTRTGDGYPSISTATRLRKFQVPGGFACEAHPESFGYHSLRIYSPIMGLSDEQNASWFSGVCTVIGNIHDNPELLKTDDK